MSRYQQACVVSEAYHIKFIESFVFGLFYSYASHFLPSISHTTLLWITLRLPRYMPWDTAAFLPPGEGWYSGKAPGIPYGG